MEENPEGEAEKKQSKAMTEAIYKELSIINGKINRMTADELIRKLKHYHLDIEGSDEVRRKRLKSHYKKIKLATADLYLSSKLYPYYVIVDFEATCELVNPPNYQHEIIEFPAVIVNSTTQEIEDTFKMFCKPIINPKLSSFCTELTGITQEQVDSADSFKNVLKYFESWLKAHNLVAKKFVIVTDGPWDMSRFLYGQCQYSKVEYPKWGIEWVNLRKSFSNFYKCKRFCLKSMLEHVGMGFEGRPHCGLDDAKNIAKILIRMMCDGADLLVNEKITKNNKLKPDKEDVEEKINFNGNWNDDINKKMKNLRLEARFTSVNYENPPPTFSRVKRERSIVEAKVAKQIVREESVEKEESSEETNEWIPVSHSKHAKKKSNNNNSNKKKKKKRY